MKTQYYAAASLDGFIATEEGGLDWLFSLCDIEDTSYSAFVGEVGALAMGSGTYEWLLSHVTQPGSDSSVNWPYQQPTWVFTSRKLPGIPGADIRFAKGDIRQVHQAMVMAAGGKNVWIVGGGELAGQFYDAGLLDELIVQVGSVILGAGKPLLPRTMVSPPLRLTSAVRFGDGMAELRYEVPRLSLDSGG